VFLGNPGGADFEREAHLCIFFIDGAAATGLDSVRVESAEWGAIASPQSDRLWTMRGGIA
jgi:hypothetical protein